MSRRRSQGLTPRQTALLRLIGLGCDTRQIAERLGISQKTVDAHKTRTFAVIGVSKNTQAVLYCVAAGLVTANDCAAALKAAGVTIQTNSSAAPADEEDTRG